MLSTNNSLYHNILDDIVSATHLSSHPLHVSLAGESNVFIAIGTVLLPKHRVLGGIKFPLVILSKYIKQWVDIEAIPSSGLSIDAH